MYDKSIEPGEEAAQVEISAFSGALIAIVGDASAFVRGDSNGDGTIDLSDAVHTLSYLFQGGARPLCFDAADANDDGLLDLSDAVRTLGFLFLGHSSLAPPNAVPDFDPTPDGMTCLRR
jgi:hypothetical protein